MFSAYDDIGKGSTFTLRGTATRVLFAETDRVYEGLQVTTLESVIGEIDKFTGIPLCTP